MESYLSYAHIIDASSGGDYNNKKCQLIDSKKITSQVQLRCI